MAKDCNGDQVEVGDVVVVKFQVSSIKPPYDDVSVLVLKAVEPSGLDPPVPPKHLFLTTCNARLARRSSSA
jgi:hypothetical protein